MDNALLFSDSFSVRLILDTYRSDQLTIVKSVGEHQPCLSPSPKFFVRFSLPPGIFMSGLEKISLNLCENIAFFGRKPNITGTYYKVSHTQNKTTGEYPLELLETLQCKWCHKQLWQKLDHPNKRIRYRKRRSRVSLVSGGMYCICRRIVVDGR